MNSHSPGLRGSSPLTRGGPGFIQRGVSHRGLIPAYAGRTSKSSGSFSEIGAHPRLRGADLDEIGFMPRDVGSSPLTRGGPLWVFLSVVAGGLIPAYAGRTVMVGEVSDIVRAHPRLRGADPAIPGSSSEVAGSSPLTRGGLAWAMFAFGIVRLIPAYAGRTRGIPSWSASPRAHPRLRGADIHEPHPLYLWWGSSPLTRGGLCASPTRFMGEGLIPAYAGRTWGHVCEGLRHGAHPRLRGADSEKAMPSITIAGSSPLTRGGL